MNLETEQWFDVATTILLSVLFARLVWLTIKRTWKWDALGRALTILSAALAIGYLLGTWRILSPDSQPFALRMIVRIVLISAAIVAITVLERDEPPAGGDV